MPTSGQSQWYAVHLEPQKGPLIAYDFSGRLLPRVVRGNGVGTGVRRLHREQSAARVALATVATGEPPYHFLSSPSAESFFQMIAAGLMVLAVFFLTAETRGLCEPNIARVDN